MEHTKTLLIDDFRTLKGVDCIARTYDEGILQLQNWPWDTVMLDHDLGCFTNEGRETTGYDVVKWLEVNPQYRPNRVVLVTSNPVGLANMSRVLETLYKHRGMDNRTFTNPY